MVSDGQHPLSSVDATPLIVVCGPTASGKSDLAQTLAEELEGCVLSADSMQVYRGMDIGTAKVPFDQRRVEHLGLDLADPDEAYSAALYQAYARSAIDERRSAGCPVVMAGGTGLYLQAVIDDLRFPEGEQESNPVRQRYERLAEEAGAQAVWEELFRLDPESAEAIHPNNVKRVIRALEMHAAGESYAQRAHSLTRVSQLVPAIQIGLFVDRPVLCDRIDARVDGMRMAGLEDEVRRLADAGFAASLTARQAIGYKEVLQAFEGTITLDEAFEQIKRSTRRYAKRQMTWFRRDERLYWIDATDGRISRIAAEARAHLERSGVKIGG